MRLSGTLRSWNDDRGFGFIAPTHGGAELFVHISALPRDGSRPTAGERLTYELGRGQNGKPQALNVERTAIGASAGRKRVAVQASRRSSPVLVGLVGLILILGLGAYGFSQFQKRATAISLPSPQSMATEHGETQAAQGPGFRCDGRRYCSQMSSCAEATFFLRNCPDTQMDGNRDGTPCEQQRCTGPLAR